MEDDPRDPRTAARVAAIRAGCALPVTQVHGSLEGRAGGEVVAAAMEPDGRHAALVLRDAVERWDLDAIACVGRWEAPTPDRVERAFCVAEAPAGVRLVCVAELWRGTEAGAWRSLHPLPHGGGIYPHASEVAPVREGPAVRVIRLDDGETLWWHELRAGRPDVVFARGGRLLLRRVSSTSFDVLEAVETPPSGLRARLTRLLDLAPVALKVVARLATEAPALVSTVAFAALHPAGKLAAVATTAGVVLGRWDDWWEAAPLPGSPKRAVPMEFTDDGRALVLCEHDRVLFVDAVTRAVREVRGAWSPTRGRVDVVQTARPARVLRVAGGSLFVAEEACDLARARAFDPVGQISCAAGTPDGLALITGADDGSVRVRDRATGEVFARAEADQAVTDVAASADGRSVLVAGSRAELRRYDRATGDLVERVEDVSHSGWVRPQPIAVSDDGRHVALLDAESRPPTAVVVDTASGARLRCGLGAGGGALHVEGGGVAFRGPSHLRLVCVVGASDEAGAVECVHHPLDGGEARLVARQSYRDPEGEAEVDALPHALSRDGALLWRVWLDVDDAWRVAVTAVDPPPRVGYARWSLDGEPGEYCAGRALFAVATDAGSLWLLSARGDHVRVAWPGGGAPLAFAPDDRALWVRDASGLLAELSVPDALFEDTPHDHA